MTPYSASIALALQVEYAVIANHEQACKAWREGRLPTAHPPAFPVFTVVGAEL